MKYPLLINELKRKIDKIVNDIEVRRKQRLDYLKMQSLQKQNSGQLIRGDSNDIVHEVVFQQKNFNFLMNKIESSLSQVDCDTNLILIKIKEEGYQLKMTQSNEDKGVQCGETKQRNREQPKDEFGSDQSKEIYIDFYKSNPFSQLDFNPQYNSTDLSSQEQNTKRDSNHLDYQIESLKSRQIDDLNESLNDDNNDEFKIESSLSNDLQYQVNDNQISQTESSQDIYIKET